VGGWIRRRHPCRFPVVPANAGTQWRSCVRRKTLDPGLRRDDGVSEWMRCNRLRPHARPSTGFAGGCIRPRHLHPSPVVPSKAGTPWRLCIRRKTLDPGLRRDDGVSEWRRCNVCARMRAPLLAMRAAAYARGISAPPPSSRRRPGPRGVCASEERHWIRGLRRDDGVSEWRRCNVCARMRAPLLAMRAAAYARDISAPPPSSRRRPGPSGVCASEERHWNRPYMPPCIPTIAPVI